MTLHLPVTSRCNIRCSFCSAAGREDDCALPALLSQIDRHRGKAVQISGGEPLLLEPAALLKILLRCRKKGKSVELQTNAILAADYDDSALKAAAKLVSHFNVNFPAHNAALEKKIVRRSGTFRKRVAGVRRLAELAPVRLTHVMLRENYARAVEWVDFVHRELRGVSWVQFSYVKAVGRAGGNAAVVPKFKRAAPWLNKAMARCAELGIRFDVDHIPVCLIPEFKEHHVDYRKMGRGERGAHLFEKAHTARCARCPLKGLCPGPRKDHVRLYGEL